MKIRWDSVTWAFSLMPWLEPTPQPSGVLRRGQLEICQPSHFSWPWNYHPLHGTDIQTIIADSHCWHKASSTWSVGNPLNNADARFVTSLYCLKPAQLILKPWLHVWDPTLTVRLGGCPLPHPHSNSSVSNWAWSSGSWEERRGPQGIRWHHAVVQHSASLLDHLEPDCIMLGRVSWRHQNTAAYCLQDGVEKQELVTAQCSLVR